MSWDCGNQKPIVKESINDEIIKLEGYLDDQKQNYGYINS